MTRSVYYYYYYYCTQTGLSNDDYNAFSENILENMAVSILRKGEEGHFVQAIT
jgi:hypothetical protein